MEQLITKIEIRILKKIKYPFFPIFLSIFISPFFNGSSISEVMT